MFQHDPYRLQGKTRDPNGPKIETEEERRSWQHDEAMKGAIVFLFWTTTFVITKHPIGAALTGGLALYSTYEAWKKRRRDPAATPLIP